MKKKTLTGLFLTGIILFSIVCVPVLAVSKDDVILEYWVSNYDEFNYPLHIDKSDAGRKPPEIRYDYGPSPSSTMTVVDWFSSQPWLKPSPKPTIPSSSIGKPILSPGEAWIKKSSSAGFNPSPAPAMMPEHDYSDHDDSDGSDCGPTINFIKVETERPGEVLTDSRTGEPYPVITDIRGNSFLAVEGCSG
jgi:hypothetical protein